MSPEVEGSNHAGSRGYSSFSLGSVSVYVLKQVPQGGAKSLIYKIKDLFMCSENMPCMHGIGKKFDKQMVFKTKVAKLEHIF